MCFDEDYSRLGGDLSTHGRVAEIYACVKDFVVHNFGRPGIAVFLHSSGHQEFPFVPCELASLISRHTAHSQRGEATPFFVGVQR